MCVLSILPKWRRYSGVPVAEMIAGRTFSASHPLRPGPQAALNSVTAQPRPSMINSDGPRERHRLRQSPNELNGTCQLGCALINACIEHNPVQQERADLACEGYGLANEDGRAAGRPRHFVATAPDASYTAPRNCLGVNGLMNIGKVSDGISARVQRSVWRFKNCSGTDTSSLPSLLPR